MSVPIKSGNIFNVEEVTGKEHSAYETTAAEAQINAPNRIEAMHVSENADRVRNAADQAAAVAKTLGSDFTGEPTTAAGQFKADVARTTEAAVSEGKEDIQHAKVVGSEYVEQAKMLASNVIGTAQNYLPTALGGKPAESASTQQKAETSAQPYFDTVKQSAAYAVEASKPHFDTALSKIQETMGIGAGAVEGPELEGKKIKESIGNVPALTFPLETGPHTVVTPYPATKKPAAEAVAASPESLI